MQFRYSKTNLATFILVPLVLCNLEIVAQRLATEYKVDAIYENTPVSTARWLTYPDEKTKKEFETEQTLRLAKDADGNPVYLATSIYNLQTTHKNTGLKLGSTPLENTVRS